MDNFKYTVLLHAAEFEPQNINKRDFEQQLLTLSVEDLNELFELLLKGTRSVEKAQVTAELLQILWHYR